MQASPLTQQVRPGAFLPKIAQLYDDLFRDNDEELVDSEGFWLEFFLLKPDRASLQRRLDGLSSDHLLQFQHETQQLFSRAIQQIKTGKAPLDENALDTLTVFLGTVLSKRYTNPSADIISILAGLDHVDAVFLDFADALEGILIAGRSFELREKAVEVTVSLTSGAYQTSLVSYFTHRDLFPALIKHIQDTPTLPAVFKPFLLLGLLANYNRFEYRNPYRSRLEDFVNESAIQKVVHGFGATCSLSRDRYVAIQDDVPEGWTVGSTLSYVGLGLLAPRKIAAPTLNPDEAKEAFADLPGPEASILLSAYDFTAANPLFTSTLLTLPPSTKNAEAPLSSFLSYTSYLLHHAHRSPRCTLYGLLSLSILRLILEDTAHAKLLSTPSSPLPVRLSRQVPPFLPPTPYPRPPIAICLDICIDGITHNLRLRLDCTLYISTLALLHRILTHLSSTRTRLQYHWSLLWQTLLSLLRFLTTYSASLVAQNNPETIQSLLSPFLSCLALAVAEGEIFLPDPESYDDLFYKLVEAGEVLPKFKHTFFPSPTPTATTAAAAIETLVHVSRHYHALLETEKEKGRVGKTLSPREVGRVIRSGFETLRLPGGGGAGSGSGNGRAESWRTWEKWREGEEKGFLKRAARAAVEDARRVVRGR